MFRKTLILGLFSCATLFAETNPYPNSLLPEYFQHKLKVKDQGDSPTCWAYAFIGAVELVVSRNEGPEACVRFNEQDIIPWDQQARDHPLPYDEVAFRGPRIESILWRIWTLGLKGSNGRRYYNITIDLPPSYISVTKRDFFTSPFGIISPQHRKGLMHAAGWANGDFAWMNNALKQRHPVVCGLLIPNTPGHALIALNIDKDNGVLLRNSWGDEMPLDLGPDTVDKYLIMEYSVRTCTDSERFAQMALFRQAACACQPPQDLTKLTSEQKQSLVEYIQYRH